MSEESVTLNEKFAEQGLTIISPVLKLLVNLSAKAWVEKTTEAAEKEGWEVRDIKLSDKEESITPTMSVTQMSAFQSALTEETAVLVEAQINLVRANGTGGGGSSEQQDEDDDKGGVGNALDNSPSPRPTHGASLNADGTSAPMNVLQEAALNSLQHGGGSMAQQLERVLLAHESNIYSDTYRLEAAEHIRTLAMTYPDNSYERAMGLSAAKFLSAAQPVSLTDIERAVQLVEPVALPEAFPNSFTIDYAADAFGDDMAYEAYEEIDDTYVEDFLGFDNISETETLELDEVVSLAHDMLHYAEHNDVALSNVEQHIDATAIPTDLTQQALAYGDGYDPLTETMYDHFLDNANSITEMEPAFVEPSYELNAMPDYSNSPFFIKNPMAMSMTPNFSDSAFGGSGGGFSGGGE